MRIAAGTETEIRRAMRDARTKDPLVTVVGLQKNFLKGNTAAGRLCCPSERPGARAGRMGARCDPWQPLAVHPSQQAGTCHCAASGAGHTDRHAAQRRATGRAETEGHRMTAYIGLLRKTPTSDYGVDFPDSPGCITTGRRVRVNVVWSKLALRQSRESDPWRR